MKILVLNAGSSTYKSSIFHIEKGSLDKPMEPLWEGLLDYGHKSKGATLQVTIPSGKLPERPVPNAKLSDAVKAMVETAWTGPAKVLAGPEEILVVGHRVVHGGEKFQKPVIIDQSVKDAIRELFHLAPLHNPANLGGIEILQGLFPSIPQVAVFDTAFHSKIPDAAATYAIPYQWKQKGIRRYGFHGISHEYCSKRAAALLGKELKDLKIITCHLGNGCSLAAVSGGISIDTTMGFTPLEGLMMGTRCGSIDPSILIYLIRENGMDAKGLETCLNFDSGLKGICGHSDMREVMELNKNGDARAKLAYEMFIHSLNRNIGAMLGSLGSIDALVFTAGIGENAPDIREKACRQLSFANIAIDSVKNKEAKDDQIISLATSQAQVLVIHTREDLAIARYCFSMI